MFQGSEGQTTSRQSVRTTSVILEACHVSFGIVTLLREAERKRERGRETERQREKEREKEIERERKRRRERENVCKQNR